VPQNCPSFKRLRGPVPRKIARGAASADEGAREVPGDFITTGRSKRTPRG
jgi:hypothetical protein